MKTISIAVALCAAVAMQGAFAQDATTTAPATPATATMPATAATIVPPAASTTAAPSSAQAGKTVPKLSISWDCGECEHNDKVIPLIEAAYAEQARKWGYAISESDVADVAIIDIRQRPPGVRVMFGMMAGKDRLGLRVRHGGNEYAVSDSSLNAIQGLNALSKAVGERTFTRLTLSPPPKSAAAQ